MFSIAAVRIDIRTSSAAVPSEMAVFICLPGDHTKGEQKSPQMPSAEKLEVGTGRLSIHDGCPPQLRLVKLQG